MAFSTEADYNLRFEGTGLQIGRRFSMHLYYKGGLISIVEFFICLGVYLHWRYGGSSSYQDTEEKGWKALGALQGQLILVLFLAFSRTGS